MVLGNSNSEYLVVKVCVETKVGELLAVAEFDAPDDLLTRSSDATGDQNHFQYDLQRAGARAYREAACK